MLPVRDSHSPALEKSSNNLTWSYKYGKTLAGFPRAVNFPLFCSIQVAYRPADCYFPEETPAYPRETSSMLMSSGPRMKAIFVPGPISQGSQMKSAPFARRSLSALSMSSTMRPK